MSHASHADQPWYIRLIYRNKHQELAAPELDQPVSAHEALDTILAKLTGDDTRKLAALKRKLKTASPDEVLVEHPQIIFLTIDLPPYSLAGQPPMSKDEQRTFFANRHVERHDKKKPIITALKDLCGNALVDTLDTQTVSLYNPTARQVISALSLDGVKSARLFEGHSFPTGKKQDNHGNSR